MFPFFCDACASQRFVTGQPSIDPPANHPSFSSMLPSLELVRPEFRDTRDFFIFLSLSLYCNHGKALIGCLGFALHACLAERGCLSHVRMQLGLINLIACAKQKNVSYLWRVQCGQYKAANPNTQQDHGSA